MTEPKTVTPDYFEEVYEAKEDPWSYASSKYEAEKYRTTLDALGRAHYHAAFEIGCSIGIFTKELARKCERLLAVDVSEKALEQARERCKNMPNVEFRLMQIPFDLPREKFDLILFSEVGYYLAPEDWQMAVKKILTLLKGDGQIALVHWTPVVSDYPQTGDAVHDSFAEIVRGKMQNLKNLRTEKYRLDVWGKL